MKWIHKGHIIMTVLNHSKYVNSIPSFQRPSTEQGRKLKTYWTSLLAGKTGKKQEGVDNITSKCSVYANYYLSVSREYKTLFTPEIHQFNINMKVGLLSLHFSSFLSAVASPCVRCTHGMPYLYSRQRLTLTAHLYSRRLNTSGTLD